VCGALGVIGLSGRAHPEYENWSKAGDKPGSIIEYQKTIEKDLLALGKGRFI